MAAPAIVVSAIQTLGELPPVHLALLAVSTIPLSVLAVYSLLSGENSNPYLTKRGFLHLLVTAEVKAICQVHYRIWNADPTREPKTFFDILDLDSLKRPFIDNTWNDINDKVPTNMNWLTFLRSFSSTWSWIKERTKMFDKYLTKDEDVAFRMEHYPIDDGP
ncbi:uncharacterized protein FMAN_14906 [Fusarium mangiferae]|uniref:Uncharacterized protein n=1 Tax=Fusarium mangiferae TaxID=192010 RepID=A0A1L7U491_FUSMA|nr:uncharacterized protein FMAN_14906 [Fusarium mangiferae]CVL03962.1 uncharacterized protein FMAN_14906 [Fusarium mangiferae]